jgi:signal peptidase II
VHARILFVVVAVLAFVVDRITKLAVQQRIEVGERIEVVEGLFELRHVHNRGIAFGMFSGAGGLVVIGTLLVGVLLFTFLLRVEPEDLLTVVGGALITGGALGNLVDRIQYRYVIDFLNLPNFPTFNVADICITVGVVLVIIAQVLAMRREHRAANAAAPTTGDADEASP